MHGATIKEYKICLRMAPEKFDALLDMDDPKIERQNTQMRDAINRTREPTCIATPLALRRFTEGEQTV
jgi:hypothetical protein